MKLTVNGEERQVTAATLAALLDELEPVEQEASTFRPKRALSWLPLLAALALATLLAVLRSHWLRRLGHSQGYRPQT